MRITSVFFILHLHFLRVNAESVRKSRRRDFARSVPAKAVLHGLECDHFL